MKAIRVHEHGDSRVLRFEDVPMPVPRAGEAVVKHEAVGVNFIDIYFRAGMYKPPQLPFSPGSEGAGKVTAVGSGVTEVKVGDRVAYPMVLGAYAEYAAVPAWKLVPLPDAIDFNQGAALLLQGLTAHYLTHSTFPLVPGHTALLHAGAGGVGLLLIQIARRLGATVYATVGTEAKAELARAAGANAVIIYSKQDFLEEVKRLTEGRGVDVIYESVGAATFEKSLDCLRVRGHLVLFGQSSGAVPPFDLNRLAPKGSLTITRPSVRDYMLDRNELLARANDLIDWVKAGELKLRIGQTFALKDAARAQDALAGRETTGKILLLP